MSNTIQDDIEMIKRHTAYTDDLDIISKLEEHGGSAIKVITQYMESVAVSVASQRGRRESEVTSSPLSINQEIYRQIRHKMKLL